MTDTTHLTIDLPAFYKEISQTLKFYGRNDCGYNEQYGIQRQKDAYYATKIANFEIIPVGNKTCGLLGGDAPIKYTHIYNRQEFNLDLKHIIAPDTRVPNYTTSLDDCIELANIIGMKTLEIPMWPCRQNYIEQILVACSAAIRKRKCHE